MSLTNNKVSPALSDEETLAETVEETGSKSSDSEELSVMDEEGMAVKHDHCYCLNGEERNDLDDLWCNESLDEFVAETSGVELRENPDLEITSMSVKRLENQEEFVDSPVFAPRGMSSKEDEETRKFFKVDLIPPAPVYCENSKKNFKGDLLEIRPNPKSKRRRRSFK